MYKDRFEGMDHIEGVYDFDEFVGDYRPASADAGVLGFELALQVGFELALQVGFELALQTLRAHSLCMQSQVSARITPWSLR